MSPAGQILDDAGFVTGANIHGLGRDVHPADIIGVGAADQFRVEIVHPVGVRLAETGPIIRGTLCIAGEPDKFIVEINAAGAGATLEFGFAETGPDFLHVHHFSIHGEQAINVVKIRLRVAPEFGVRQFAARREIFRLAADQIQRIARKLRANFSIRVHDHRRQGDGLLVTGFVADL